ncbi:MAG: hypothetical protein ABSC76_18435 [Terracidiphilus sp.]|jgi:hypothetical protein
MLVSSQKGKTEIPDKLRPVHREKFAMSGAGRGLKDFSISVLWLIIFLLILFGIKSIWMGVEDRRADRLAKRLKTDIDFRSLLLLEDQLGQSDREGDCFIPYANTKVTNCRDHEWDGIVDVWVTGGTVVQAKIYRFQTLCGQREKVWTSRIACGLPVSIDDHFIITYWNPSFTTHY